MALGLLSNVIEILQSTEPSPAVVLKLVVCYIYFEFAMNSATSPHTICNYVFKPHYALSIIQLFQNALETEFNVSRETDVTRTEKMVLEHASIVIPWLWRASQHGIRSDFVQNMVLA